MAFVPGVHRERVAVFFLGVDMAFLKIRLLGVMQIREVTYMKRYGDCPYGRLRGKP